MNRTMLAVAALACLALAACGDSGSKKAVTKRDQSNAPKFQNSSSTEGSKQMVEGDDPARKQ